MIHWAPSLTRSHSTKRGHVLERSESSLVCGRCMSDVATDGGRCRIESTYNYPLVADPRDVLWFLRVNEALLKTTLKFHFTCAQYSMTHILSYVAPLVCFDGLFFRAPRNAKGLVVLHKQPHQ